MRERVSLLTIAFLIIGCEASSTFPVFKKDITVGPLYSYLRNPILSVSDDESAFDGQAISSAGVVQADNRLIMYFTALSRDGVYSIGRAESTDGINWIKNENSVIAPDKDRFDEKAVIEPAPLYDGEKINLFFVSVSSSNKYRIMVASSSDTLKFFRAENELVSMSGGDLKIVRISEPSVVFADNGLVMYYSGIDEDNRSYIFAAKATFDNPLLWTPLSNTPVFLPQPGRGDAFDQYSVSSPSLLSIVSANNRVLYRMYYCGSATEKGSFHIGLAGSFDGVDFERYIYNPLLHYGRSPSAIVFKNNLYVYYNELPQNESKGISLATTVKISNE